MGTKSMDAYPNSHHVGFDQKKNSHHVGMCLSDCFAYINYKNRFQREKRGEKINFLQWYFFISSLNLHNVQTFFFQDYPPIK